MLLEMAHMCLGQWFADRIRGLKMKGLIFLITTEKEGHKKLIPCESVTTALDNDDIAEQFDLGVQKTSDNCKESWLSQGLCMTGA